MAITIKATVVSADVDEKGVAKITLEFDDNKGKWKKSYNYNQTDPINFANFKETITTDLRKDLKVKDQLANISDQIGKQFTITI